MNERMFMLSPAVAMAARVNMPAAAYPLDTIAFDTVTTGAYTNVRSGMTVLFGSAAGKDDYGRQRVRAAATSSNLYIGRSSIGTRDGEVTVVDNAYITVLHDYRVWAKIPYINDDQDTFKDSSIPWNNSSALGNARYQPPVANTGPGFAATINGGTGRITVQLDGSKSRAFDDATGWLTNPVSYSWGVGDGTITVGTSSSSIITATFPAGFRWVSLTVTDAQGKQHTAYCPIFARDPSSDLSTTAYQITNWVITPFGQELNVRLLGSRPRSTYPDGTLVMIWDGEPSGPSDRSHMKFIGWHHAEEMLSSAQRTGTLRDDSTQLIDAAGRLKMLPGFSQLIRSFATVTNWEMMRKPNMLKYLHYLLYWHSSVFEVVDWLYEEGSLHAFPFVELGSDADNLYNQANSIANAVTPDHWLACTRRGQLKMVIDPLIREVGTRPSDQAWAIYAEACSDIRYDYTRSPRVHWLRGAAVMGMESDAIIPSSVPVTYTLIPTAQANIGDTVVYVADLPVDIPSGATITWNLGVHSTTLTANAAEGATSIQVVALTEIIDAWARPQYSTMIDGPPNVPTYFCIAPGNAPGQGESVIESTRRIATSQAALNNVEGNRYARANARLGHVTFTLPWELIPDAAEPANMEFVRVYFNGEQVPEPWRGWHIDPDGFDAVTARGIVHSIEIQREYARTGIVETATITWEEETSGPPAVTTED